MSALLTVCTAMCEGGAEFEQAITAPDSGLTEAVFAFTETHGRGARHWLESRLAPGTFGEHVSRAVRAQGKNGFFSALFSRKKK